MNFCNVNYYKNELNIKELIKKEQLEFVDEAINICDLTSVVQKYQTFQKLMPGITPYYAVKCNNDAMILKMLAKLGANFDCASKNEIKQILEMGISPDRINFANPCKFETHLQYAKKKNIPIVTADNELELHKISKHYPKSNLVLRFNNNAREAAKSHGFDPDTDTKTLMLLAKKINLKVIGIRFNFDSFCHDNHSFDRAISTLKTLFDFGKLLGFNMNLLDIACGFSEFNDGQFEKVTEYVNTIKNSFDKDNVNIIAETSGFFVAAAYTLICMVHSKREVRSAEGKLESIMYYLNDGIFGCFNGAFLENRLLTVEHYLDSDENLPKFKSVLFGPTCDSTDKILDDVNLPNMQIGDFIGFPNMGANSTTHASTFNGFMRANVRYFMDTGI